MNSTTLSTRTRIVASIVALCLVCGTYSLMLRSRGLFEGLPASPNVLAAGPASTRTYREGSRLYLDNGTVKVGFETKWGGAITEIVWHGMNFVNDFDTGRDIQVAVYDGDPYPPCGDCKHEQGWDPVQAGDWHKHGSPLLAQTLGKDSVYTKTQPYHWQPDNKGGGVEKAIPGDVFIEQWVSFMPDVPFGIKVHYKVTHFGMDQHTYANQEFPAVYVNWELGRFVYYGGEAPWTNASVSFSTMPNLPKSSPQMYVPERWGGFVNDDNVGLVVFAPGQFPNVGGFSSPPTALQNSGTHYFAPHMLFSFGPNSVLEDDAYVFAGDYQQARKAIYSLHRSLPPHESSPPYGVVDEPKWNAKAAGPLTVTGWAISGSQVTGVDISVDGRLAGPANYGVPRPDVAKIWSHVPSSCGFRYILDTTRYTNGPHVLGISVKDTVGHVVVFSRTHITVDNQPGGG
jgi:hypothetical protein